MEKSLNKFAIVADSVMHFPLLRIDERIPLFFRFIDIIDLICLSRFSLYLRIILEIKGEVCLFRVLKKS